MSSSTHEGERPLRWGLLGCGHICNDFVLALNRTQHLHVISAIGGSDQKRAVDFVNRLELQAKAYGSYQQVLEDDSVDVVYIGLRNILHCEWTLKALRAGKHVLCEKPLAVNLKEVELMITEARKRKLFLMPGFWSQFFPVYRTLQQYLDDKSFGEARLVHATFGYSLPSDFVNLERGETMLTTLGCYTIMLAMFVFKKKPVKIEMFGGRNVQGADSWTNLHLNFGENKDAILLFDERHSLPNDATVGFEKGSLRVSRTGRIIDVAQICEPFWAPTNALETKADDIGYRRTLEYPLNDDQKFNYPNSSGLRYEQDHVFEMLASGRCESDIITLANAHDLQETIDEIRRLMGVVFPQDGGSSTS